MIRPLYAVRLLQEVGASVSQRFPGEMTAKESSLGPVGAGAGPTVLAGT